MATTVREIIPGVFEAVPAKTQRVDDCCCDCCPTG